MLSVAAGTNNRLLGFSYDVAGNLLSDGSFSYTYDAENRMKTGAGVTYTYDGDGKRVQKSNGKLYWYGMGGDPLAESDGAGTITDEFIFFNGKRIAHRKLPSGEITYYFADHLGTSRVVTNATGTVLDDSDFYPFGGERPVVSSSGNNYKFTGKERDAESGLDYFGARYNTSSLGRFMSPDSSPKGIAPGDPQSWNLYSYVRNRPTRSIDVGGNWATDVHAEMVTIALQGYVSAGELQHLIARQYAMDKDQSPSRQYTHAMRQPGQSAEDASNRMWSFVATNIAGANATLGRNGSFTSTSLDWLGDAIHTVEDYTSPMHTSASGEPLVWGGGAHPIQALGHWQGENSPSDNWADFGKAIRLTMAAFMQANPELARKNGLTEATFDAEANRRISDYVDRFYRMSGNVMSSDHLKEAAARQCALGNPAACDH